MSYILTYLRVALATSETLEIPATDEIHTEDQNQTCVLTVLISEQHVYGGVKIHEATCR